MDKSHSVAKLRLLFAFDWWIRRELMSPMTSAKHEAIIVEVARVDGLPEEDKAWDQKRIHIQAVTPS